MMRQASWTPTPASHVSYRSVFNDALKAYEEKSGKVLSSDPLLRRLEKCHSPDDVITVLLQQIPGIDQSWSSHSSLTSWLNPTVNVINSFSAAIDGAIGLVSPTETEVIHPQSGALIFILQPNTPAGLIFTAIGVLFSVAISTICSLTRFCNALISQTANAVNTARGALPGLLERIETVFRRLETYIKVPMTAGMTEAIVRVMTEVLCVLAIATKEISQNYPSEFIFGARLTRLVCLSTETFVRTLVGRKDIEDALQRLEKVTVKEARITAAEALNGLHDVGDEVLGFHHKDGIQNTPRALEDEIKGIKGRLQEIDVRANGIRNTAIKGASNIFDWSCPSLSMPVLLGAEKQGRQMTTDFHAVAAEGSNLKTVHGISDNGRAEELQGTWNRARIPDGTSATKDYVAGSIDGKQVILLINRLRHTESYA
jgi:hypothetical protein